MLLEVIEKIDPTYMANELLSVQHAALMKLHEMGLLELALDMLQIKFVDDISKSEKFAQAKKYLDSNVGVGAIIMNMLIP